MLLRSLARFGILILACVAWAEERPHDVNICNLGRVASQFDGKIVRISGVLQNSDTSERPFFDELVGKSCKGTKGEQVNLQVVSPDSHFLSNPPEGYKPDMGSLSRAEPIFERAAAHHRSVFATVEGVFYVANQPISGPVRHRRYPAFVVIQALRDVKER
jgi:hypothetical protein